RWVRQRRRCRRRRRRWRRPMTRVAHAAAALAIASLRVLHVGAQQWELQKAERSFQNDQAVLRNGFDTGKHDWGRRSGQRRRGTASEPTSGRRATAWRTDSASDSKLAKHRE